ncbi:aldehyde dehydrogenase [Planctomycetota bacterium]|nr:aldehyde dehydrogenase [Planctomycetota bacterium]
MSDAIHLPALRRGVTYRSVDALRLANGAEISQVNSGLIRRDLLRGTAAERPPVRRMIAICREAGARFRSATLPLCEGIQQSPEDFLSQVAATGGLPRTLIRAGMERVAKVLDDMEQILAGLSRGLDPAVIDDGIGQQAGIPVSYHPTTEVLSVVLPSNSPGVNALWLPAIALRTAVAIKPGRDDPWTPWRIIQALLAAGCPAELLSFYPTDHEGSHALLRTAGRSLLFGDAAVAKRYARDPRVEIHGPGHSKVLIGADHADRWRDHLDLLVKSVAANSGRSCINASAIVTHAHADVLAHALAERLGSMRPRDLDDPAADLAGFSNAAAAELIDAAITAGLAEPGAADISATYRAGPRLVVHRGRSYLLPTVIRCTSFDHPLARKEYPFPYCAVVELPQAGMLGRLGPTLVVSALSDDPVWRRQLLASPLIQRLNLGAMATSHVQWDQPHEGNLFEFLYHRRAVQVAA